MDDDISHMMDDGPVVKTKKSIKPKEIMRYCVVTGNNRPQKEMIRFVVGVDMVLVPDLKAVLPGRGIWVSSDIENLKIAVKRNLFAKAMRSKVQIPDGLGELIENLLLRRVKDRLSQARRAGQAVAGFEKVKSELTSGRGAVILSASDGAKDGRDKIMALARKLPIISILSSEDLSPSFAKDNVIHVLMQSGGIATGFLVDVRRLAGFR